jgi:hypothetical protein
MVATPAVQGENMKKIPAAITMAIAVLFATATAALAAGPPPGGFRVGGNYTFDGQNEVTYLFVFPGGSGCDFEVGDPRAAGQSQTLTAPFEGWFLPYFQDGQETPFHINSIHTHVSGTIPDAAGRTWQFNGTFFDDSLNFGGDLRFDGNGRFEMHSESSVVAGEMNWQFVSAPNEVHMTFAHVTTCRL